MFCLSSSILASLIRRLTFTSCLHIHSFFNMQSNFLSTSKGSFVDPIIIDHEFPSIAIEGYQPKMNDRRCSYTLWFISSRNSDGELNPNHESLKHIGTMWRKRLLVRNQQKKMMTSTYREQVSLSIDAGLNAFTSSLVYEHNKRIAAIKSGKSVMTFPTDCLNLAYAETTHRSSNAVAMQTSDDDHNEDLDSLKTDE